MKTRFPHTALVWIISILLASACSVFESEQCPEDLDTVRIAFTLSTTGGTRAATKASVETDEDGSAAENHIDIAKKDYRVLFTNGSGKIIYEFEPQYVSPIDGTQIDYYVYGELSAETAETIGSGFSIVVLANWGETNYPGFNDIKDKSVSEAMSTATFNYAMDSFDKIPEGRKIPMYGAKQFTGTSLTTGLNSLGEIDMLRALAKIELNCDIPGITIDDVTLTKYNANGLFLPDQSLVEDTTDAMDKTWGINIPTDRGPSEYLPFIKNTDGTSWVLYVPEYEQGTNISEDTAPAISFTAGAKTYNIYFCEYNDSNGKSVPDMGTGFSLLRNHYYSYTIRSISTELSLYYTVCPWETQTSGDIIFE